MRNKDKLLRAAPPSDFVSRPTDPDSPRRPAGSVSSENAAPSRPVELDSPANALSSRSVELDSSANAPSSRSVEFDSPAKDSPRRSVGSVSSASDSPSSAGKSPSAANAGAGKRASGPPSEEGSARAVRLKGIGTTLKRILRELYAVSGKKLALVAVSIVIAAAATSGASVYIINMVRTLFADAGGAKGAIVRSLVTGVSAMAAVYLFGVVAGYVKTRVMVDVTYGFLDGIRRNMFGRMQNLPIRFFDANTHGDIMSNYTNDVDSLVDMVDGSLPNIFHSLVMMAVTLTIMLVYSVWLTLLVLTFSLLMLAVTRFVGGTSAKYFLRQQKSIAKAEGFVEESMHGQKVIKVFNHESEIKREFDAVNQELFENSDKANGYANMLMPMLGNIGNMMYVLLAFVGSIMIVKNLVNVGLSGITRTAERIIPIVVGFLTIGKQFTNQIIQSSQQINAVIRGLAGSKRIFDLLDEAPESDDGCVTLVNAKKSQSGELIECAERTGLWAWRCPCRESGETTYVPLRGDIELAHVDFGYEPGKTVLHDVSLRARPGEKYAFVGATGAGKTTITNLLTRFYDIADGKIRYDGISINKIKKGDLRASLGLVLQDTSLFTGTIRENIRYGKLDATDEEVIEAAKIANAHDFITRLPEGYDTVLTNDGANLSQGQRQLLSIARAATEGAPVMIMDEATSSIDTRTEKLVQEGTDRLMQGRTVFVIAHRLSTVRNADTIMVLDGGRVIERGTHKELLALRGTYYGLYTGAIELD